LAHIPDAPIVVVPDAWELSSRVGLVDVTGEGTADALVSLESGGPKLLLDVDNDTQLPPGEMSREQFRHLIAIRGWHSEAGLDLSQDEAKAFYDCDNDGAIDLIIAGDFQRKSVTKRFERTNGRWRAVAPSGDLINQAHFQSKTVAAKFQRLATAIRSSLANHARAPNLERRQPVIAQ
jgi:hypothetical protein